MKIIDTVKNEFSSEIEKIATKNIIKKLKKQDIDYTELNEIDFKALVADEIEILKSDTKKVGAGIGIGIAISLLTGIYRSQND